MLRSRSVLPVGSVLALAVVLAVGFVARALVVLHTPLLPGPDGAYYLVQVRGILRGEGLPIPDVPLLFYALAGIARVLVAFGEEQASAIVSAVRWTDTLFPLSLAVAVHAIARETRPERAGLATLVAGLLAVASGNVLVLAGGAIKNGVVLSLCLAFIYWLARGEHRRSPSALLLSALFLAASCLTHVSAIAVATAFAVPWIGLRVRRHGNWRLLAVGAGLAGAAAVILWADPARGARVIEASVRPWSAVSPDWRAAIQQPAVWLGNGLGILGLVCCLTQRPALEPWVSDLTVASSVAALALSCPLLRPDLLERLALVSIVPGLVVAVVATGRQPAGTALVAPLLLLALAHGFLAAKTVRVTGLTQPAFDELRALGDVLPARPRIVLVSPPLRWWAAWTLDSTFSTSADRVIANRRAHGAILVIDEIRPGAFGRQASPVASTPGAGLRDGWRLEQESFEVLRAGTFFRLSRLVPRTGDDAGRPAGPDARDVPRSPL